MTDTSNSFAFGFNTQDQLTSQAPITLLGLSNFLGGLNLARADSQLFDNESGDLCNIDPLESGGICRRNPVRPFVREDLPAPICNIVQWQDEDGNPVLYMILEDGTIYASTGNNLSNQMPALQPFTVPPGHCESIEVGFNQYFFGPDGDAVCVTDGPPTNGGTSTVLPWETQDGIWTFANDCIGDLIIVDCDENGMPDFEAELEPLFSFPQAECMTTFSDFAWAANVIDPNTGQRECNRVYRSAPLTGAGATGQLWMTGDYFDVNPGDGDCITNIVSCGSNLYVFKNNSVYAITGITEGDVDAMVTIQICGDVGTPSCKTVACCECDLYFWDARRGLYRISDGATVEHMFGKLENLIRKGCIRPGCEPAIGCCNGRIHVSVPEFPVTMEQEEELVEEGPCTNTTTYVLTPQTETWTKYTYGIDCYLAWCPRVGRPRCLAVSSRDGFYSVVEIDRPASESLNDFFNHATGFEFIESYWRSKWFTGDNPFVLKDWCAPQVIAQSTRTNVGVNFTYLTDWCIDESIGGGEVTFFDELAEDFEMSEPEFEQIVPGAGLTPVCPPSIEVTDSTCPISNEKKERQCAPSVSGRSYAMQIVVTGPIDRPWCICDILLGYRFEEYVCA